ncbi:MAG TPA: glycoside hydrolase family 3 N-terminal domain-containing protein [Thermoanaerobaculia bacterium]|nr:glycoside hydrolase family 3 N-terminal domain-containing protein [Thermoanaerobaculia bacterium]
MRRTAAGLIVFLLASSLAAQTIYERADALLRGLTLEEKIGQLLQFTAQEKELTKLASSGQVGCVFNVHSAAQVNELQRAALESRLKIPILFAHDVIHGYRTMFPIPLGIAATWDPASAEVSARVAAQEASARGIRWTFAPMVDIARDPRWGRIAEGAGEDPYLGSAMAAAYVRGYQGKNVAAPDSILACAKHYAAYGAAEGGRDYNTVDMSERRLREVYLPPFKAAVDAGAWTLMSAFDALNGIPASANRHLLTEILRDDWGFKGFVDSDWEAVKELIAHGVAANDDEAALKAITAGVDMDMVDATYRTLPNAVKEGRLAESVIDTSVRRILRAKFALGLFERPFVDEKAEAAHQMTKEELDAARHVAQKSIVLLKNERDLLPLSKNAATIAIIGALATSKADVLGSWTADAKPEDAVTIVDGIRAKISGQTQLRIAGDDLNEARTAAQNAELAVLVLGEKGDMTGEANSRASLDLPGNQEQLLETVVATGTPVVLVAMSGRPLTITWAATNVRSILWTWFPGTQAGNAIADVLFGDVNPSAKLPVTIPRTVGQVPIYYAQLPTGRPANPSDKYTSKYTDVSNEPLYPFGFGLSYTKFEYANLRVDGMTVSADVRNSGTRAGDEVVQLYVRDLVASVSRPVKELKGFTRVSLAPGETRRVEFTLTKNDLRFWSDKGWTFEAGRFSVWIGSSSAQGLEGTLDVP